MTVSRAHRGRWPGIVAVGLLFAAFFTFSHVTYDRGQIDFNHVYLAGVLLKAGQAKSLYTSSAYGVSRDPVWIRAERKLPDGVFDNFYTYSPLYALPFAAASGFISYKTMVHLMFAANMILFCLLAVRLFAALPMHPAMQAILLALFFTSESMRLTLLLGQNILMAGLCVWLFVHADLRGRRYAPMLWLALAVLCKTWCAVFVLMPVFRRRYLAAALAVLAVFAVLGLQALVAPGLLLDYFRLLKELSQVSYVASHNYSFGVALARFSIPNWSDAAVYSGSVEFKLLIGLIQLTAAGACGLIGWIGRSTTLRVTCCLAIAFFLLGIFWAFYMVMFFPVIISTLQWIRRGRIWLVIAFAIIASLGAYFDQLYIFSKLVAPLFRSLGSEVLMKLVTVQLLTPALLVIALVALQSRRARVFGPGWQRRLFAFS